MKILVVGGTGPMGSKLVTKLGEHGHEPVAAAPDTGVNTLTGEGPADAVAGAQVVIDVSNSPSWGDPRQVVSDPHAHYFDAELLERSPVPDDGAVLGRIRCRDRPGRNAAGK